MLVLASPQRKLSADMVPGRIGALALRCAGTFELDRIDWIRVETERDQMFYFMQRDKQRQFTSLFGPLPALVGSLALLDFGDEGDIITDASLRTRERCVAALLVGISAVLLMLACMARASLPRAAVAGAVVVLSFAGAATLGQGLWQATPAMPFLCAALATTAWRERKPRLAHLTPALLVLAVMIRPVIAPLCLGIGVTWAIETRFDRRGWLIAIGIALVAAAPFVVWNALHQNSPLPIAQWNGNKKLTDHVFVLGTVPRAVAGLLASPARGLLWFAPIAVAGLVMGCRDPRTRWIAAGCVLQILLMAAFFKWHGGQAFGPRLLTELTWVAAYMALGTLPRAVLVPAVLVTVVVGQLGLWRYRPEQWERRRGPDIHPEVLWDVVDSPIPATLSAPGKYPPPGDDPPISRYHCEQGRLRTDPAKS